MTYFLDSAIRFGLDLAVKATFVFAATAVALLLLRRSTAATRHRVGTFGLGAALLLPFLSAALPQVTVPILPDVRPAAKKQAEEIRPAAPAEISWRQLALAVPEKTVSAMPEESMDVESVVTEPESNVATAAAPPVTAPLPARRGLVPSPSVLLF